MKEENVEDIEEKFPHEYESWTEKKQKTSTLVRQKLF